MSGMYVPRDPLLGGDPGHRAEACIGGHKDPAGEAVPIDQAAGAKAIRSMAKNLKKIFA